MDQIEKDTIERWQQMLKAYESMPKGTREERIAAKKVLNHINAGARGFMFGQDDMARRDGRERTRAYNEAFKIADSAQTALNRLDTSYEENKTANREFMDRQKVEKAERLKRLTEERRAEEKKRQEMIKKAEESSALVHGTMMGTHPHMPGAPAALQAKRKGFFSRFFKRPEHRA